MGIDWGFGLDYEGLFLTGIDVGSKGLEIEICKFEGFYLVLKGF